MLIRRRARRWIPSLRECVEARPGHLLASVDYEAGELITHAQSCIWITGYSELARALLAGIKPHNALGARILGTTYEAFQARLKQEKACVNSRQSAKPANFGFPGGLGPIKLVHQQRKQGPDTPHPSGKRLVKDDNGKLVPGYKGLRFCLLMDNALACGIEKVSSWGRRGRERRIAPTCKRCIECALRLKEVWSQQWPENEGYFEFINECVDEGMTVTRQMLARWPHLREVYDADTRLAPGEIMQHVSGRIRCVTSETKDSPFCAAANGFFQGLLADAAKAAVRRISRECYDASYRVPAQLHANSLSTPFAGTQSPLYGNRLIVFQHDEVIPELREHDAHEAATRVSEVMVDELRYYCPDLAPVVAAPPALMGRWLKGAEPKYAISGTDKPANTNDRLVAWEPKALAL